MFQQKLNKDTILHYGSMLLGAAVLSFGLFNVHSQSKITEGGILGLTLFLHHWTGISPGIFSFLLDMTCYIIGFQASGHRLFEECHFFHLLLRTAVPVLGIYRTVSALLRR